MINLVSTVLLTMPLVSIGIKLVNSSTNWVPNTASRTVPANSVDLDNSAKPDIYYIILDGYARSDTMKSIVEYDNHEFISFLEGHNFYIADESSANHNWTALSIASSLNMDYAHQLGLDLVYGNYPAVFVDPIRHSNVRAQLESLGYQMVAFRSGYIPTEIIDADYYFSPDPVVPDELVRPISLNAFEGTFLRTTAGLIVWDWLGPEARNWVGFRTDQPFDELRNIILYQIEQLHAIPEIDEPTFTFVHIVSPHSPYLFGPNGEHLDPEGSFTLLDSVSQSGSTSKELYAGQAQYISNQITDAIAVIIRESGIPPIIILQSDHGPCLNAISCQDEDGDGLIQRFAILNAYHLPAGCENFLYPQISPVNSFRLILNCYFEMDYPLLEDHHYLSKFPRTSAYEFILVNDRLTSPHR